ncbi:MAG TPA: hypothetical protein DCP63_04705 [Bacteroidetes bacterium]|nr:hypothetical protein [Bacteroidota bacterium]
MARRRHSYFRSLIPILLLLPYIVAFRPNGSDSSNTIIRFGAGIGSYADVARDCSGNIVWVEEIPFVDGAVAVDHYAPPIRIGAKAGVFRESRNKYSYSYSPPTWTTTRSSIGKITSTATYVNPSFGLHWKYFGIDAGALWISREGASVLDLNTVNPQGALRIGNRDSWFFSMGVFDNVPLVSGGGLIDLGFGFSLDKLRSKLWLGLGGGVFDDPLFVLKGDVAITDQVILNLRGMGGSLSQGAASVGVSIKSK